MILFYVIQASTQVGSMGWDLVTNNTGLSWLPPGLGRTRHVVFSVVPVLILFLFAGLCVSILMLLVEAILITLVGHLFVLCASSFIHHFRFVSFLGF